MNVILQNIEPFNDVLYQNCFFNSLFPVLRYYDRDIALVMANAVICFTGDDPAKGIGAAYYQGRNDMELCREMNLSVRTMGMSERLERDVCAELQQGNPVIIWIDSYYESIREDTYLKKHQPHTVLIFGYHESGIFYIIDHENVDTLSYRKRLIPASSLSQAHDAFCSLPENKDGPAFYAFSETGIKPAFADAKGMMQRNYNQYRKKIQQGRDVLRAFISFYQQAEHCGQIFRLTWMQAFFNDVHRAAQFDFYRSTKLGWEKEVVENRRQYIAEWNQARLLYFKCLYADEKPEKQIKKMFAHIRTAFQLDEEYLSIIL